MSLLSKQRNNIILIGMPGAGKSTIGVVLAKRLGYHFMDCDLLIQDATKKRLFEIIAESGTDGFLRIEEETICSIETEGTVIATGGSAVYGKSAIRHLKETGIAVYLQLSCQEISERLGDLEKRGVTLKEGQTLSDLYTERVPLYEEAADVTLSCSGKEIREIVSELEEIL